MSQDSNQTPLIQADDQIAPPATSPANPPVKTAAEDPLNALEELIQQSQQRTNEQSKPVAEAAGESNPDAGLVEPQKTLEEIEQLSQVKELEAQQQIEQQQAAIQENMATAPEIQRRAEAEQAVEKAKEAEAVVDNMEIRQLSHTKINK